MKLINKKVPDKKVDNKGTNKITEITQYLCKQSQYYMVILEKEQRKNFPQFWAIRQFMNSKMLVYKTFIITQLPKYGKLLQQVQI